MRDHLDRGVVLHATRAVLAMGRIERALHGSTVQRADELSTQSFLGLLKSLSHLPLSFNFLSLQSCLG